MTDIINIIEKCCDSFTTAFFANITSAFILFYIGYRYVTIPKVKISTKITKGITLSDNVPKFAYKFKIVNTSRLFKARDFTIKLFAVKKILHEREGVYTPHLSKPIKIRYTGLQELSQFISKRKFRKCMNPNKGKKKIKDKSYSFVYRIITFVPIDEKYKDYDGFKLCVEYKDTLGHVFSTSQYIEKDIIVGNFTCDGDLNKINDLSESEKTQYETLSKHSLVPKTQPVNKMARTIRRKSKF